MRSVISINYTPYSEKAMAPHSSTLAWKIPWTEEPGRLQPMGSRRVRHNWATSLSLFTFMPWRRKWPPTPVFLPGESQGRGAWWAAVYGVAQSRTRLKWLSSSSSSSSVCMFILLSPFVPLSPPPLCPQVCSQCLIDKAFLSPLNEIRESLFFQLLYSHEFRVYKKIPSCFPEA